MRRTRSLYSHRDIDLLIARIPSELSSRLDDALHRSARSLISISLHLELIFYHLPTITASLCVSRVESRADSSIGSMSNFYRYFEKRREISSPSTYRRVSQESYGSTSRISVGTASHSCSPFDGENVGNGQLPTSHCTLSFLQIFCTNKRTRA